MNRLKNLKKTYIKYCRPYEDEGDEPPVDEIWSDGDRPKKKLADGETLYVYDDDNHKLINERIWDGIE